MSIYNFLFHKKLKRKKYKQSFIYFTKVYKTMRQHACHADTDYYRYAKQAYYSSISVSSIIGIVLFILTGIFPILFIVKAWIQLVYALSEFMFMKKMLMGVHTKISNTRAKLKYLIYFLFRVPNPERLGFSGVLLIVRWALFRLFWG